MFLATGVSGVFAQSDSLKNMLEGKTAAVFLSKKHFTFPENYLLLLSQFIKAEEEKRTDVENIKQSTLILLGEFFCGQSEKVLKADSVYFLSEYPDLARQFLDHYSSDPHYLEPLDGAFGNTDYILVVSPLTLGGYQTSSVYARSNRIITEKIYVKTARMRVDLYDPVTGHLKATFHTCFDDRKSKKPGKLYNFHNGDSPTGQFLANLFSAFAEQMAAGVKDNCE